MYFRQAYEFFGNEKMDIQYTLATLTDIEALVELTGRYHANEKITSTAAQRKPAIEGLLLDSTLGFILLASSQQQAIAYLAVCYSYSIELGGRDAFIDELYVDAIWRGKGVGSTLLTQAKQLAIGDSIKVLHLEVTLDNHLARGFYRKNHFTAREQYHLMSCELI